MTSSPRQDGHSLGRAADEIVRHARRLGAGDAEVRPAVEQALAAHPDAGRRPRR